VRYALRVVPPCGRNNKGIRNKGVIRGGERETSSRVQAGSAGPIVCGSRSALWDSDFVPSPPVYPAFVAITACRCGERREAAGAPCMCPLTFALFIRLFLPAVTLSVVGGRSRAPFRLRTSYFVSRRAGLPPLLLLPSALYTFVNFTLHALPSLLPSPLSPQPQTTTSKARFQVMHKGRPSFCELEVPPGV